MGLIDKLFPSWALNRERAKIELEFLRDFTGAAKDRFSDDWFAPSTSIDAELADSREELVRRSRDLNRNDPHASAATSTRVGQTIGDIVRIRPRAMADDGETMSPALRGAKISEKNANKANKQAAWAWRQIDQDIDGRGQSFSEFLQLVERQICESGESLIRLVNVNRLDTSLTSAVQIIEPDRLANPIDLKRDDLMREGVEFNGLGERVAYWIAKSHPGDSHKLSTLSSQEFDRIPAENVLHVYETLRPGQTRGQPWLTPAIRYFRDKGKWFEAELIAQRLSACLSLFVRTDKTATVRDQLSESKSNGEKHQTIKAGQISYLRPGEEISQVNPLRPGEQFVPSIHEILRAVGSVLHIPYVVLAQDFENVNYSSMRAAIVHMQTYVAIWRERIRSNVILPVYGQFYDESVMAGIVQAPNYIARRNDYQRFTVQWPAMRWVDPDKEIKANIAAVESKLYPHETIAAQQGMDVEEIYETIAAEKKMRIEKGIDQDPDTQPAQPQLQVKPNSNGANSNGQAKATANGRL